MSEIYISTLSIDPYLGTRNKKRKLSDGDKNESNITTLKTNGLGTMNEDCFTLVSAEYNIPYNSGMFIISISCMYLPPLYLGVNYKSGF